MKLNRKSLVLLVCVAVLLTITVSGTVAFLVDSSGPVTNVFTTAKVEITVEDKVENNVKKDVVITNNSTIPVYIRVAVVGNWVKEGSIVAPWNDYDEIKNVVDSRWESAGIYYYYNSAVPATTNTLRFFAVNESYTAGNPPVEGAHLEMDILVQAVQADGMGATSAQDAFEKAAVVNSGT